MMFRTLAACALLATSAHAQSKPGTLVLTPAHPVPGERVSAVYQPSTSLSGADSVELRGRLRTPEDRAYGKGTDTRTLAMLAPDPDGAFRGEFVFPDSVLFALLAVATPDAVDTNLQQGWPVQASDASRAPLPGAYVQHLQDLTGRDFRNGLGVARQYVEHHPDSPEAWSLLWFYEGRALSAVQTDSAAAARPATLARLDRRLGRDAAPRPPTMAALVNLAVGVGDTLVADRWREQLRALDAPAPEASRVLAIDILRSRASAPEQIVRFEAVWNGPRSADFLFLDQAFYTALRAGDRDAALRWAQRRETALPYERVSTAEALARSDATRQQGVARLRILAESIRIEPDDHRGLFATAKEHRRTRLVREARLQAALGQALAASGERALATQALSQAAHHLWQPDLAQDLAALYLSAGDSLLAAGALARAVVFEPAGSDSLAAVATTLVDPEQWQTMRATASRDYRQHILADAVSRPLDSGVEGLDRNGDSTPLRSLFSQRSPTVIAFVSRFCEGSRQDSPAIQALADELAGHGVQLVAVTDEPPSDEAAEELARLGLDVPILYDTDRVVSLAFANAATPMLFVVDERGQLRYEYIRDIESVSDRVEAIRHSP